MQNDVTLRNMNSRYKKKEKIHLFEWLIIIDYYIYDYYDFDLLHTICISLFKLKISSFYYSIMNFFRCRENYVAPFLSRFQYFIREIYRFVL